MDLAKHWRQRAARYRLEGQRHRTSGKVRFPPAPTLGESTELWEPYALSGVGTVFSFTVVRQPPAGYEQQSSYLLALVKLAEGSLITAQLSDCETDHVTIDMQVEVITRRLRDLGPDGLIIYAYKFRPLLS
jgi:uncharacterized OB-fold protein